MEISGTLINGVVSIDVAVEFEDGLIGPDDETGKFWCLGDTTKEVVVETRTPVLTILI